MGLKKIQPQKMIDGNRGWMMVKLGTRGDELALLVIFNEIYISKFDIKYEYL